MKKQAMEVEGAEGPAVVHKGQTHEDVGITIRCLEGGEVDKGEHKCVSKRKSGIEGHKVKNAKPKPRRRGRLARQNSTARSQQLKYKRRGAIRQSGQQEP